MLRVLWISQHLHVYKAHHIALDFTCVVESTGEGCWTHHILTN